MLISKRKRGKKLIIVAIVAAALFVGLLAVVLLRFKSNKTPNGVQPESSSSESTINYAPPTAEEKKLSYGVGAKSDNQSLPQQNALTVDITHSSVESGTLYIRTLIAGTEKGDCLLTLQKDGLIVNRSAPVILQANYATCSGFNVPTTDLSEGLWKATVKVVSGNNEASSSQDLKI